MELYKKAAENGSDAAYTNMGELYRNGQGVAQDYQKAMELLRKAAEKGRAAAMSDLGSMYEKGQGVVADIGEARRWYRKAADAGSEEGKAWLAAHPAETASRPG
jgi:TPR repeat protein